MLNAVEPNLHFATPVVIVLLCAVLTIHSIPGATRISEFQLVWNGIHSALVRINEELLERKVAAPVQKTEINDRAGSAALTKRHPSIHKSWH
jgi:hypothetical protein